MNNHLRKLPLAMSVLLAACASVPSQTTRPPPSQKSPVEPIVLPAVTAKDEGPLVPLHENVWDQLRGSFAMSDCDSDPAIMTWARRYTRNPQRFEQGLQQALPRLVYVQSVAAQYDIAGEFVLLPWVESQFQPIAAKHRHRPAGIWQIMPATAEAMGLRIDKNYDGRMDMPAAAHAVMKILKQYHDQFHDWRLVDYAYNAGEYHVRKQVAKHGIPADAPVIPDLPVSRMTREHLAKLLAIACVVREPDRFNVSLPELPDDRHLVKVNLPQSMPMARAADHAGMSVDALKHLNAAYRSEQTDASASSYLVLPAGHVEQFQDALLKQSGMVAADDTSPVAFDSQPSTAKQAHKTHTVKRGESLWQIARRYSVRVSQLQRLNDLRGDAIKPGQVLQLN